jgi:hypothetical protein
VRKRTLPSAESLRWSLAAWGTAVYPFAALVIALTVSHGRKLPQAVALVLATPDPISACIGYGAGYLIVQYRIRNASPSFLQSQLFGACAFAGMFVMVALLRVVLPAQVPPATALAIVIPAKVTAGAVTAALVYPWLSHRQAPSARYRSAASRQSEVVSRRRGGRL